jgi:hypothetical protein
MWSHSSPQPVTVNSYTSACQALTHNMWAIQEMSYLLGKRSATASLTRTGRWLQSERSQEYRGNGLFYCFAVK